MLLGKTLVIKVMLEKIKYIFGIRQEERIPTLFALAFIILLNVISLYYFRYTWGDLNIDFNVSGFDEYMYIQTVRWHMTPLFRHPLFIFMMWPFAKLNELLLIFTGRNFAMLIITVLLVTCSLYSFIFLFRILRNIVGVTPRQANILCALFFSMGYIMLTVMVPDSFCPSMFCILLTLWIAGEKLRNNKKLSTWQTIILFILTSGLTLSNGLKVYACALITRKKSFFNWRYLFPAVLFPLLGIVTFAKVQSDLSWEILDKESLINDSISNRQCVVDSLKTLGITDKSKIEFIANSIWNTKKITHITPQEENERWRRENRVGSPILTNAPIQDNSIISAAYEQFVYWTDNSLSRWDAIVNNIFGEGIQIHRDYTFMDAYAKERPVIVKYSGKTKMINYAVEFFLVLLLVLGIFEGRKEQFLWMISLCLCVDILIHLICGFGLEEVYIYAGHWMFFIPVSIGYLIKRFPKVTVALSPIICWIFIWNIYIIFEYYLKSN